MRQLKYSSAALVGALMLTPVVAVQAQVVNTAGTWSNMVVPNDGGGAFWDNTSLDGARCNIGYFLLYKSGSGFGACNNQLPTTAFVQGNAGRLGIGVTGAPNGSYLSESDYSFKAGSYRIEFLGNVAGFGPPGQQLGVFQNSASPASLLPIYPVGTYPNSLTTVFDFTTTQNWFLGALHATGGADYSTDTGPNHGWTLFSSRSANNAPGSAGDVMYAGFGDMKGGDQDYNDLIVQITSVPEPGSIALTAFGLAALALAARRRRRA